MTEQIVEDAERRNSEVIERLLMPRMYECGAHVSIIRFRSGDLSPGGHDEKIRSVDGVLEMAFCSSIALRFAALLCYAALCVCMKSIITFRRQRHEIIIVTTHANARHANAKTP
jgi:hypothetical protein